MPWAYLGAWHAEYIEGCSEEGPRRPLESMHAQGRGETDFEMICGFLFTVYTSLSLTVSGSRSNRIGTHIERAALLVSAIPGCRCTH